MAIVATEIESTHGDVNGQRLVFYRCQDSQGAWHSYGPVISNDAQFDADAHKTVVSAKIAERLAQAEADAVIA